MCFRGQFGRTLDVVIAAAWAQVDGDPVSGATTRDSLRVASVRCRGRIRHGTGDRRRTGAAKLRVHALRVPLPHLVEQGPGALDAPHDVGGVLGVIADPPAAQPRPTWHSGWPRDRRSDAALRPPAE